MKKVATARTTYTTATPTPTASASLSDVARCRRGAAPGTYPFEPRPLRLLRYSLLFVVVVVVVLVDANLERFGRRFGRLIFVFVVSA